MKHTLLAAALLLAGPALAQQAPPASNTEDAVGTIAALDAKNGFRKFKFGTPISELPSWERRARNTYVDPMELKRIGDVELNSLKFMTYQDKFSTVLITVNGVENCRKLLAIFEAQYGKPQREDSTLKQWIGNRASIAWQEVKTYGAYGTTFTAAAIMIYNNELNEAAKDAETDKAQKAGRSDL